MLTETPTTTKAPPTSPAQAKAESKLREVIKKYEGFVDPLVRVRFSGGTTTAAERTDMYRSALVFQSKGPNTLPPPFPVSLPMQTAGFVVPAGADFEPRFSGAQQVANWVADVQSRPFTTAGPQIRMTIQLTSDNGLNWSATVDIYA